MNYAKAIAIIRSVRGLSKNELAEKCELDKSLITRIENGERIPSQEIITTICNKLEIPEKLFDLLAYSKDPNDSAFELGKLLLEVLQLNYSKNKKDKSKGIFTLKHLAFILGENVEDLVKIADSIPEHYSQFTKTLANKKPRKLVSPSKQLKRIQRKIAGRILNDMPIHPDMYGGVKGRSIRDNALVHVGRPEVITIDIKKCFPNTSYKRIYQIFREEIPSSKEVASLLTKLTTYRGELPQGAPSSSALINIVLTPMIIDIAEIASQQELRLSTWVDDITLSGKDAHKSIAKIAHIIQQHGYAISNSKISVMAANRPQEVTGIIVNSKPSVPKNKLNKYIIEANGQKNDANTFQIYSGRLAFINYINPTQGRKFKSRLK